MLALRNISLALKHNAIAFFHTLKKCILLCVTVFFSLSKTKVAKATAVADEALGNVRTVKAFAMEERELQ